MNSYLQRKASPWVSAAVLGGGLASALILFFLVRVETNVHNFAAYDDAIIEECLKVDC